MKKSIVVLLTVVVCAGLMVGAAFGAGPNDKLIVTDAGGVNTVFVVQNTGKVGVGTGTPDSALTVLSTSDQANTGYSLNLTNTLQNSAGIAGTVITTQRLTFSDKSTAGNLSKQVFRLDYVRDGVGTGSVSAFDSGLTISPWIYNNAAYGFRAINVEGPSVAAGKSLSAFYGMYVGSGAGTTSAKYAFVSEANAGNVGLGTTNPTHRLVVCDASGTVCSFNDGGTTWTASSRAYKENIQTLSAEKAAEALKNLTPVTYNYKSMPEQGHVGFIAEDVPALVAEKDRKALSPMDIVAVLTKVLQDQNRTIEELSAKVERLEKAVAK